MQRAQTYMLLFVDAHLHAYEYTLEELSRFSRNTFMVGVAEDISSSLKLVRLAERIPRLVPCVGIHPWRADKTRREDLGRLEEIVSTMNSPCIGEVGLDLKFTPQTIHLQREVFHKILGYAVKYDAILNLHTPGAWREVYSLIKEKGIGRAVFHWYTGPLDLIEEMMEEGEEYFISVNAAAIIQKKSRKIIERTPLHRMLTESDGPYNYRGLNLGPKMIPRLYDLIAGMRGLSFLRVSKTIYSNYNRLYGV